MNTSDALSGPLFAILDAARESLVWPSIRLSGLRHQSLYQGSGELEQFGPVLVQFEQRVDAPPELLLRGWGRSWGVLMTTDLNFENLRRHLRRFLAVTLPNGKDAYFRFYDPRVLRIFLANTTPEEATIFFGEVQAYWVESEDGSALTRYTIYNGEISATPYPTQGRRQNA